MDYEFISAEDYLTLFEPVNYVNVDENDVNTIVNRYLNEIEKIDNDARTIDELLG